MIGILAAPVFTRLYTPDEVIRMNYGLGVVLNGVAEGIVLCFELIAYFLFDFYMLVA